MTATESVTTAARFLARSAHPPVRTVSHGVGALLPTVVDIGLPDNGGEVLAAFVLAGYVDLAVPVVALGLLGELLSTGVLMTGFAAVAIAVLAVPVPALREPGGRLHREALS